MFVELSKIFMKHITPSDMSHAELINMQRINTAAIIYKYCAHL